MHFAVTLLYTDAQCTISSFKSSISYHDYELLIHSYKYIGKLLLHFFHYSYLNNLSLISAMDVKRSKEKTVRDFKILYSVVNTAYILVDLPIYCQIQLQVSFSFPNHILESLYTSASLTSACTSYIFPFNVWNKMCRHAEQWPSSGSSQTPTAWPTEHLHHSTA